MNPEQTPKTIEPPELQSERIDQVMPVLAGDAIHPAEAGLAIEHDLAIIPKPSDLRENMRILSRDRQWRERQNQTEQQLETARQDLQESKNEAEANRSLDPATQLPRQELFRSDLAKQARIDSRKGPEDPTRLAIYFWDITSLKIVNNEGSEALADSYLETMAKLINGLLRADSTLYRLVGSEEDNLEYSPSSLYRWGGDEFAVLIKGITQDQLDKFIHRINDQVKEAVVSGNYPIFQRITEKTGVIPGIASAGFVYDDENRKLYPDPLDFQHAVLYAVKHDGKLQDPVELQKDKIERNQIQTEEV